MPAISIVIPVYNIQNYVEKCLSSVLSQTFKDYEVIIVNDGSTDSSLQICETFSQKYDFITIISKNNEGLAAARLTGFQKARGTYIAFIDGDDTLQPDYLLELHKAITETDSDLAMCGYNKHLSNQTIVQYGFPTTVPLLEDRSSFLNYIYALLGSDRSQDNYPRFVWNKLYKRELLSESFFQSERKFFLEDHVFNLIYVKQIQRIALVHKPLYNYIIRKNSLTTGYIKNKWIMFKNLFQFLDDYTAASLSQTEAAEILKGTKLHFLIQAVDNTTRQTSYSQYIESLKDIMKDPLAKQILRNRKSVNLTRTEQLSVLLLKLHLYRLYYNYRKWRRKI